MLGLGTESKFSFSNISSCIVTVLIRVLARGCGMKSCLFNSSSYLLVVCAYAFVCVHAYWEGRGSHGGMTTERHVLTEFPVSSGGKQPTPVP